MITKATNKTLTGLVIKKLLYVIIYPVEYVLFKIVKELIFVNWPIRLPFKYRSNSNG